MSQEELEIQFKRHDFIILQRGSLALAETKGREAGLKRGLEKGREEGRLEEQHKTILALSAKGLDAGFIADTLNLPLDHVQQLLVG